MKLILTQSFFNRPTCEVARDLLGKYLVRVINKKILKFIIHEVEAYDGPYDLACHARVGKTKRTEPMFGQAGHSYIYFVYGVHWMLNIVAGPKDYPAAVLIRGAGEFDGPAKITKHLQIDKNLNAQKLSCKLGLWVL
jgi:DNA-3-methyladenine glycosylase